MAQATDPDRTISEWDLNCLCGTVLLAAHDRKVDREFFATLIEVSLEIVHHLRGMRAEVMLCEKMSIPVSEEHAEVLRKAADFSSLQISSFRRKLHQMVLEMAQMPAPGDTVN